MNPLLTLAGVSKRFGGVEAVRNLNFSVAPGEILGLIGPNGAGKTTVFNLISGVVEPTSGRISFAGRDIQGKRPDQVCLAGIARTFQTSSLLPGMSARENVHVASLFRREKDGKSAAQVTDQALALCGLTAVAGKETDQLTTSEQKRVEVARAYATGAKLIMTDEVVAGLNGVETDQILDILQDINRQGVTLIFVEHDVRAVMRVSHRLIVLAEGALLAEGDPAVVARSADVIRVYLGSRYAEAR
jgi:branched-chain amino acid transport system ATP-binding protein